MSKTLAFVLATALASTGASLAAAGPTASTPSTSGAPAAYAIPGFLGRLLGVPKPVRVAQAPSADKVLAGVQKFYAGISHVKALFRQEVKNATFGRSDVSDGQLWIAKPGKMRWDYYAKKTKKTKTSVAKSFISNGSYLYVVDNENKQVIKKDLQKNLLPTAVTFLYGKGDLAADFTPSIDTRGTYGGKGDTVLELTPKASSTQYKKLYLVVDPSDFRVKESIIIDGAGNSNHFRFFKPDFDAGVKDGWFEFSDKTVKSYRMIDGDAAAPDGADKTK
jgi:outer membrane lipoprotein carrier protein